SNNTVLAVAHGGNGGQPYPPAGGTCGTAVTGASGGTSDPNAIISHTGASAPFSISDSGAMGYLITGFPFQPNGQFGGGGAGIARRSDRVIQRRGEVCRAAANGVRVVESVECFETELPVEMLGEFYVFEQREVGAPETRPTNGTGPLGGFGRLS